MIEVADHISNWLKNYNEQAGTKGYVVGVSGGVDSALTSTLCARTGLPVETVIMPIHQVWEQTRRGVDHTVWLRKNFKNVSFIDIPLSGVFDELYYSLPHDIVSSKMAMANSKARIRMTVLYAIAGAKNMLVAGTGNKVEDFGLGFFTKGGDGMVDVSPIGMLTKTEVWALAKELGVSQEILDAPPTDGLHEGSPSDEDQIGASYQELERIMNLYHAASTDFSLMTEREKEVYRIYHNFHTKNSHKMQMPPICPRYDK